jgi:hypothetical protein
MASLSPNLYRYRPHRSTKEIARRVALLGPVPEKKRRLPESISKALAYPSVGAADRARHLRDLERKAFGTILPEHEPTDFEKFGARAISGTVTMIEPGDGSRKLGSAWGRDAGSAALNRAITRHGKEKIKGRRVDPAALRVAMAEDARAVRKATMKAEHVHELLPPEMAERKRADNRNSMRKRRAARHDGHRKSADIWETKVRVPTKKNSQARARYQRKGKKS